jgi:cupin superfamily acireductone dioxygenase involved in methionine salvage
MQQLTEIVNAHNVERRSTVNICELRDRVKALRRDFVNAHIHAANGARV